MIFLPSMMVKIVCIGDLHVVDGATEAHDIEMIHFPGSQGYFISWKFALIYIYWETYYFFIILTFSFTRSVG